MQKLKMSENGDTTQITPLHVADSDKEDLDGEEEEDRHPRNDECVGRKIP